MLEKTRAIVLKTIKYGDTSLIVRVYTEAFGKKSVLLKGARSKKNRPVSSQFFSLNVLNLELYHKEHKELLLLKEASPEFLFTDFPYKPQKSAQAMFIAEILGKVLQEEEPNPTLFEFLLSSIQYFDLQKENTANFHLAFLMKLTPFLGIQPAFIPGESKNFLDYREGKFISEKPLHDDHSPEGYATLLLELLSNNYAEPLSVSVNKSLRNKILDEISSYFETHNFRIKNNNTLKVLKELF